MTKKSVVKKAKLPMTITLSTGYAVEFDLGEVNKGLLHLARALLGEIFLETARQTAKKQQKSSWEPSMDAVITEITTILEGMDAGAVKSLLHAVIWDVFSREAGKIGNRVNKKHTNKIKK